MAYDSDRRLNYLDDEVTSRLGAINAIYRGTIAVDTSIGATATATITAVVMARSMLYTLGHTVGSNTNTHSRARLELTNTTTVTARGEDQAGTQTITAGYQVVEYAA